MPNIEMILIPWMNSSNGTIQFVHMKAQVGNTLTLKHLRRLSGENCQQNAFLGWLLDCLDGYKMRQKKDLRENLKRVGNNYGTIHNQSKRNRSHEIFGELLLLYIMISSLLDIISFGSSNTQIISSRGESIQQQQLLFSFHRDVKLLSYETIDQKVKKFMAVKMNNDYGDLDIIEGLLERIEKLERRVENIFKNIR